MDDIERRQINNAINTLNDSIRLIDNIRVNTADTDRRNWDEVVTKLAIIVDNLESRVYEEGDVNG